MAFKRVCECGKETGALYYYKSIAEGKFDKWSEVKYETEPNGYKYDPIPCSILCKNWENFVLNEEGVPYEKKIITEEVLPPNE